MTDQTLRSVKDPETGTCEHSVSNELSGTIKKWYKVTGSVGQTLD
jgi:hypothetical protein